MACASNVKKRMDDVLVRKIHENPRYKNVKPVINTGATAKKLLPQRIKEAQKTQRYNEIFKRIRISTFVSLMIEVAKEELEMEMSKEFFSCPNNQPSQNTVIDQAPMYNSVLSGVGELDLYHDMNGQNDKKESFQSKESTMNGQNDKKESFQSKESTESTDFRGNSVPFLLLDVRSEDEYKHSHILTAKNYPSAMLCRTCNYESKDLLSYKNVHFGIIILYDDDEIIAVRVATTLCQRGYNNVFVLTGGLKLAKSKFTDGLIYKDLENLRPSSSTRDILKCCDIKKLQAQLDDQASEYPSRASTAVTKSRIPSRGQGSAITRNKPWK